MSRSSHIRVYGARQHNLKHVDVAIPRGCLTVLTGVSGSGKSSLAFDTIHAEGRRKYVESLSVHARQFLAQMQKPDVDRIEGLSPTIAIEQRLTGAGPRSTIATSTEIYDYLRVLWARAGEPRCWICGRPIARQSTRQVVEAVLQAPERQRMMVLAPLVADRRGKHEAVLGGILKQGFIRARIDGEVVMIEEMEPLAANRKHTIEVVVDRLTVKPEVASRLADSIEIATGISGGRVIIAAEVEKGVWSDERYSAALACPEHAEVRIDELSPQLFSFNSPRGACPACHGLGTTMAFDPDLVIPDWNAPIAECVAAWRRTGRARKAAQEDLLKRFCATFRTPPDTPFKNVNESTRAIFLNGTTEAQAEAKGVSFEGVLPNLERLWETTGSESLKQWLHAFTSETPCTRCQGTRLRDEALAVRLHGRHIAEITSMTVAAAHEFFTSLKFKGEAATVAAPLVDEITRRLRFMLEVGVDYLTLSRASATLSGGEWQRIRLATQIGSGLAGICYVLDEPTVGLHPRDSRRLARILQGLAEIDNTVIVVEHDDEIIQAAHWMIDVGPGAGARGGAIIAEGVPKDVLADENSITAAYLNGRTSIPQPAQRRTPDWNRAVSLTRVTANNLKSVDVKFPLGCLTCVTGVSGSGKSTLVNQVFLRAVRRRLQRGGARPGPFGEIKGAERVDHVIDVDQSPIGRTPRSTPATFVGALDPIRKVFAMARESKVRGYGPQRFSFNIKGGRCDHCEGQGVKRIAMHFLPDVFVTCDACNGSRYNPETLEIRYRGKTIADVLEMEVSAAAEFFQNFSNIHRRLSALIDVGLGYLTLGQPSTTLSGGEAQRIKLAAELRKNPDREALYVLDEPTTGLHFDDVRRLLAILNRLVDRGHTVVVIEHHLDVIAAADWLIDLGPEGGNAGGEIVVAGTPEDVARCATSHTGEFLKARLHRRPHPAPAPDRRAGT